MGLFDKKELHTSSQTLQLMEDTPEILKQSAMGSIMNGTNIATDLVNTCMNSFANQAKGMYRYARDHYTNGLPEGSVGRLTPPNEDALELALNLERPPVDPQTNLVVSSALDSMNPENFAYEWLRTNTDWNQETNDVTIDGSVWQFDSANRISDSVLELVYTQTTVDPEGDPIVDTKKVNVTPLTSMVLNHLYYVTIYQILDEAGTPVGDNHWWVYDEDSHKYPALDVDDTPVATTQYLPVVPLRISNVSLTDEKHWDTPLYKTSKKLLKKVDLHIEDLHEGVNENPDIDAVDHAYLVFGIDVHTDKQESDRYLYEYFNDLFPVSAVTKAEFEDWFNAPERFGTAPLNVIDISDGTYVSKVGYYYIDLETHVGKIAKVNDVVKTINGGNPRIGMGPYNAGVSPDDTLVLSKQVDDNNYITITVSGLFHSNKIYGPDKDYISTLAMSEERSLIIPLNVSIINQLPILHANTIYYDAFKIVFNSFEWVKLKWYQTGFFKFVTAVIAVAITIIFPPAGGLVNAIIAGAGFAATALVNFVVNAIVNMIIGIAIKFTIKEIGGKWAILLAAVAAVFGVLELGTALDIVSMSMGDIIGSEMAALQEEMAAFQLDAESKMEELEELKASLDNQQLFDPIGTFTDVDMYPGESFDGFYLRKMMVDPATLSLDVVNDYYSNAFYLPTV